MTQLEGMCSKTKDRSAFSPAESFGVSAQIRSGLEQLRARIPEGFRKVLGVALKKISYFDPLAQKGDHYF